MTWQALVAIVLPLIGAHNFTVPVPRLYQDDNIIVTLRPAFDLDFDYVGVSLLVRPTPSPPHITVNSTIPDAGGP